MGILAIGQAAGSLRRYIDWHWPSKSPALAVDGQDQKALAGEMMRLNIGLLAVGLMAAGIAWAEVCTTQAMMTATDRDALAAAARGSRPRCRRVMWRVAGGDGRGVAKDFSGLVSGGNYGAEAEGRDADGGAGVSAGWLGAEARCGWHAAGRAVFLHAEQVDRRRWIF